jgi:hypothetical protein
MTNNENFTVTSVICQMSYSQIQIQKGRQIVYHTIKFVIILYKQCFHPPNDEDETHKSGNYNFTLKSVFTFTFDTDNATTSLSKIPLTTQYDITSKILNIIYVTQF